MGPKPADLLSRRDFVRQTAGAAIAGAALARAGGAAAAQADDGPPGAEGANGRSKMDLDAVRMSHRGVTHLGVIQGCLRYLGREVDDAWLFGATGYAFMINVPEGVGVWGPQAWNSLGIEAFMPNLGVSMANYVRGNSKEPDFAEKQTQARALIEEKLDADIPCYGAEHGFPDYFTIFDYNEEGMRYHCDHTGEVMRKWEDLGTPDTGTLIVGCVEPLDEVAPDAVTVREALDFALLVEDADPEAFEAECTGPAAYDNWIEGLQGDKVRNGNVIFHPHGTSYNATTWSECRQYAEPFLREAGQRLDPVISPLFDAAAGHYSDVARSLRAVARLFAWPGPELTDELVARTVGLLTEAREAEAAGLKVIREIVSCL